ncbi:hypothetical protein HD806DRAFT_523089 [Xylariaceae sp. AK1471]|nr:hypothetical protein HD806DRAFT_523089 [Xylariaceae sp. AK1471]
MCYYQNIHTAHHHALLSIDAAQRERHCCEHKYPDYKADKCPLHACCRLTREVIISCKDADVEEGKGSSCLIRGGGYAAETGAVMGIEGDEVCDNAFVEDVFVPFPEGEEGILLGLGGVGGRDVDGEVEVEVSVPGNENEDIEAEIGLRDAFWAADGPPILEFWPADGLGAVVRVYPEEVMGREYFNGVDGVDGDVDEVREQDRAGRGSVWSWFPCFKGRD